MNKFVLLLLVFLNACSSKTQLHLYARHLTPEQTKNIINNIDKSLFNIIVNQQQFPDSINSNAIVYAPSKNSRARINTLIETLATQGYAVSNASLLMANNHSFSENNLGVFLLPAGKQIDSVKAIDMDVTLPLINEYGALDCANASTLYLRQNHDFLIEIEIWQADIEDYRQEQERGHWRLIDGQYLELTSNEWQQSLLFERRQFERKEINGVSKGVSFIPMKSLHSSIKNARVNCRYSISLAVE